jgi:hypothetical protein
MRSYETMMMACVLLALFVLFMSAIACGILHYYIIVTAIEGIFTFIIGAF